MQVKICFHFLVTLINLIHIYVFSLFISCGSIVYFSMTYLKFEGLTKIYLMFFFWNIIYLTIVFEHRIELTCGTV